MIGRSPGAENSHPAGSIRTTKVGVGFGMAALCLLVRGSVELKGGMAATALRQSLRGRGAAWCDGCAVVDSASVPGGLVGRLLKVQSGAGS
ncbi:protein of unknown function [Pararobbsia alpina]